MHLPSFTLRFPHLLSEHGDGEAGSGRPPPDHSLAAGTSTWPLLGEPGDEAEEPEQR